MSGKGSKARPFSVSREKFSDNWDAIFKKKNAVSDDTLDAYNEERLVSKYDKIESKKPVDNKEENK